MIADLRDPDEENAIAAAEQAVCDSTTECRRLHVAAATRILRAVFPDAAAVLIYAGDACGHNDSNDVDLEEVRDAGNRPLWTTNDEPPMVPRCGVRWSDVQSVVEAHLAATFDDSALDVVGWEETTGDGFSVFALHLPPACGTGADRNH